MELWEVLVLLMLGGLAGMAMKSSVVDVTRWFVKLLKKV